MKAAELENLRFIYTDRAAIIVSSFDTYVPASNKCNLISKLDQLTKELQKQAVKQLTGKNQRDLAGKVDKNNHQWQIKLGRRKQHNTGLQKEH